MIRLFLPLLSLALATAHAAEDYRIDPVRDNVYRFTDGHYNSVFMVTEEGIVVTDPIRKEAAEWLKAQLAERFEQPIRYVIYSHDHPDHVYGGEVFEGENVDFISHELARESLLLTKAQTRIPNLTFVEELTLHVGESSVRLRYHGANNGKGSISMMFEPAGVLHVVDWVVLGRMPYQTLSGYDVQGMMRSTKEVLDMDFEVFVGGHAENGTKEDIRRYLGYLEALHSAVLEGIRAGKDLETLKSEIKLPDYSDLAQYEEWLPMNIEGMYNQLLDQAYMLRRPEVPKP